MGIMEDKRIRPDTPEVEENGNSELNMEEAPAAPGDLPAEQLFDMEPDPDGADTEDGEGPVFSEEDHSEEDFFEEDFSEDGYSGEDFPEDFGESDYEDSGEGEYPDGEEEFEEDDDLTDDDHTDYGDSTDENVPPSTASSASSSPPSSLKPSKKAQTAGKTAGPAAPEKSLENTLARVQSAPASGKKNKKTVSYKEKILRHKRQRIQREVLLVMMIMYILTVSRIQACRSPSHCVGFRGGRDRLCECQRQRCSIRGQRRRLHQFQGGDSLDGFL